MAGMAAGGDPKPSDGNATLKVDVNGEAKTVTADDVKNLFEMQSSATVNLQKAAAAIKAAEKYNVSVEDFIQHAEGTMGAFAQLVDQGIINERGELITKSPGVTTPAGEEPKLNLDGIKDPTVAALVKKVDTVMSAIDKIGKVTSGLEKDNLRLLEREIKKEIKVKHPELDNEDIDRVLGVAKRDGSKDVWEHAESMAEKAKVRRLGTREAYAKEFGIDLKEFDANKIKENDPEFGKAGFFVKGKKLSFNRSGKKEEGVVTPRTATESYFSKVFGK